MVETTLDIGRLALRSGATLDGVKQRVTMYGDPAFAEEIVLVTHALTGDSRAADWWAPLIGRGRLFDPADRCIICINTLGSCYGSSGPGDTSDFPAIGVADMVAAQAQALRLLGINFVDTVIGGSLGGMQALEWALAYPHRVGTAIVIGAYDHFSAQGIALNTIAREAIQLDPQRGLALARKIALVSYKSDTLLEERHANRRDRSGAPKFDVEGYLDYHGAQFSNRMCAASYVCLTRAMDTFDVRDYAIRSTAPRLLFAGISSDELFRPQRVRDAVARFRNLGFDAAYAELESIHGHDAFLADALRLSSLVQQSLRPMRSHNRTKHIGRSRDAHEMRVLQSAVVV